MDKKELVGRLLMEGKISNEEAITLLSTQEQERELTMIVNPIEVKLDKLLDEEFIDELFDYDKERIGRITEFMDMASWTWLGEKVTPQMFRDTVISHIKRALIQLIEDYRVHNVPKCEIHTCVEGGGIQVDCTIDDGDEIYIDIKFIAGTWFQEIKLNDIL